MRLLVLLLFAACSLRPPLEKVDPPSDAPTAPAYLGEASGIYQLRSSNAPPLRPGERFLVAELEGTVMLSLVDKDETLEQPAVTFSGALNRDDAGGLSAAGEFSIVGEDVGVIADAATLTAALNEGSMVLAKGGQFSKTLGCPDEQCTLRVQKICDFDSTLSGVYEMTVTLESENGDCSAATDLTGARQWGLTTINSTESATIIALDADRKMNMALSLRLDRLGHALHLRKPLPTPDGVLWATSQSVADLSIETGAAGITLRSIQLVRALPNGCVQTYSAVGTRARGTAAGVPCEQQSELSCSFDVSGCPQIPRGAHPWEVALSSDASVINGANGLCPGTTCEYRTSPHVLCDFESRVIAGSGCRVYTGRDDTTVSIRYGMGNCAKLECVPTSGECGRDPTPADVREPCPPSAVVAIAQSDLQCNEVRCRAERVECPAPIDCGAFGLSTQWRLVNGCITNVCKTALTPTSFTADETTVLQGPYVITGFNPGPLESSFAEARPTLAPASGNSGCPPFPPARYAGIFQCPKQGMLTWEACPMSSASNVTESSGLRIGISRRTSGLCFEMFNTETGDPAPLPFSEANGCQPQNALCCTGLQPTPVLSCVPAPAQPKMITFSVTNQFAAPVAFDISGGGASGFNRTHVIVGPSTSASGGLPLGIAQMPGTSYVLSLSNESARCVFANMSSTLLVDVSTDLSAPLPIVCEP